MLTINVKIDLDLDQVFEDQKEDLAEAMLDLQDEAYDIWKTEARTKLNFSRDEYVNAIQAKRVDDFTVRVYLDPDVWLPNALETGWPTFWMWKGLLASRCAYYFSPKAKVLTNVYKLDLDEILARTKKYMKFWEPPPFFDVPFKSTPYSDEPERYARMSRRTTMKFRHPGFRPKGTGGLKRPLREFVIDHIVDVAPDYIRRALKRVTV